MWQLQEEIITSPINSRIVEVYRRGGDSVDVGTPILKLDLQSTETEYKKLLDEEEMRRYKLEQLRVNNQTKLSDMAMQIKVSAMKLNQMKVELRNEHYLDSLGAGTTDKVRQAELSYNVAQLEYEQLKQQYDNEKEVAAAELKVQELDFNIFRKNLAEMKRTLDDAQIRSPRKAILTYINNQVGAQVPQGGQVAIISDLSHFKVEGEIADTYGDRVAAGGKAIVKIGTEKLEGVVSSVTPLSKNGVISFSVQLMDDNNRLIDELTFYSKIDTNKIPYTFSKINVSQYFRDCVEEVGLDMEARGIELGYFNYVDEDVVVIADAEQMKRVINNIISNSVKYLDKKKGIINIRIKDDGDFIQVEIEDNGKGIAAKDLPNIFDRFYRTDSSRNSSQGGSGIGLSIVRKIIEDHGGRIWATSKEGIGTEVHFVLRKYQEVVQE